MNRKEKDWKNGENGEDSDCIIVNLVQPNPNGRKKKQSDVKKEPEERVEEPHAHSQKKEMHISHPKRRREGECGERGAEKIVRWSSEELLRMAGTTVIGQEQQQTNTDAAEERMQPPAVAAASHSTAAAQSATPAPLNEDQIQKMLHDVEQSIRRNIPSGSLTTTTLHEVLRAEAEAAASTPTIPLDSKGCDSDKDYWNFKSKSPQCPRGCPSEKKKDNIANRQQHYKGVHYDIYYDLVQSKRTQVEHFLCKNLGDGKPGRRACINCKGSSRYYTEFTDRSQLVHHLKATFTMIDLFPIQ